MFEKHDKRKNDRRLNFRLSLEFLSICVLAHRLLVSDNSFNDNFHTETLRIPFELSELDQVERRRWKIPRLVLETGGTLQVSQVKDILRNSHLFTEAVLGEDFSGIQRVLFIK
jgi:hypothetical protein